MPKCPLFWPSRGFVFIGSAVLSRANILEDWIYPLSSDEFFATTFEKQWAHFPHDKPLVPITLEHVAEWMESQGRDEEVIETLPHPKTLKPFRSQKQSPVQYIQEAFLQGHSMVINSLNQWSEPGLRVAKELNAAGDLPVDVYMYLTPPHSQSYEIHSDVMDAFMVQLGGAKSWKVCDVTSWMAPGERHDQVPLKLNGTCQEILMQKGDVMYLPYGTLHQASTSANYSMHLTVNVERQYYVWLALIFAMIHKVAKPEMTVESFLGSHEFTPDDMDNDLYRVLVNLSPSLPMMHRLPGNKLQDRQDRPSKLLITALCNEDLPVLLFLVPWAQENLRESLLWALQVARAHSIRHAALQLPKPHLFESLSTARQLNPEITTGTKLEEFPAKLPGKFFSRAPKLRAVLLDEPASPARLMLNNLVLPLTPQQVPAAVFCLGLYGKNTSQGRPFQLAEVPLYKAESGGGSAERLVQELLLSGALDVIS
eukprot:Skav231359  [mRNA]  locus=scaffold1586:339336:341615:+ [translate_table: standard]